MTQIVDRVSDADRYSRLRLLPWWDQAKISDCKLLVVGAGALGNEILKNAALLGFRNIVIVDLDRIDESNLSRTILFRDADIGKFKAEVAAEAYRSINPDAKVQPIVANVVQECGLGLFQWSDLIIAGLDNREARLWINRSAWKVNRPWIDGAIEGINGVARVFLPGLPPCYECTLGEVDWQLMNKRMSCNLLSLEAAPEGKVPTTPTISSVIGGIQVQEAMKLIHGLPTLAGKGYIFEGMNHSSYVVEYTLNPDCMSHYKLPEVIQLEERSDQLTVAQLRSRAQQDIGASGVVIEFSRDIVQGFECPACGSKDEKFAPLGSLSYRDALCPMDGQLRTVVTCHNFSGNEGFGARHLNKLGLPLFDAFVARCGDDEIAYIPTGDAPSVLGPVSGGPPTT